MEREINGYPGNTQSNRRSFLKKTALAFAGVSLGLRFEKAEARQKSIESKESCEKVEIDKKSGYVTVLKKGRYTQEDTDKIVESIKVGTALIKFKDNPEALDRVIALPDVIAGSTADILANTNCAIAGVAEYGENEYKYIRRDKTEIIERAENQSEFGNFIKKKIQELDIKIDFAKAQPSEFLDVIFKIKNSLIKFGERKSKGKKIPIDKFLMNGQASGDCTEMTCSFELIFNAVKKMALENKNGFGKCCFTKLISKNILGKPAYGHDYGAVIAPYQEKNQESLLVYAVNPSCDSLSTASQQYERQARFDLVGRSDKLEESNANIVKEMNKLRPLIDVARERNQADVGNKLIDRYNMLLDTRQKVVAEHKQIRAEVDYAINFGINLLDKLPVVNNVLSLMALEHPQIINEQAQKEIYQAMLKYPSGSANKLFAPENFAQVSGFKGIPNYIPGLHFKSLRAQKIS